MGRGVLFLTSFIYAHPDGYSCNHDKLDFKPEDLDVDEGLSAFREGRVLSDYPNLRMIANYDSLASAPSVFATYIQEDLVPPVLSFLSAALKVKYPVNGLLISSSDYTCDVPTPSDLQTGVNADYYIIFDSSLEDSTTVASSRACQVSSGTRRPLTAYSNINRNSLQDAGDDILLHEKNMYLVIHELLHTLGISRNSYYDYLDNNGQTRQGHVTTAMIGGYTQTIIDIPELTQRLRDYYGCPSVPGLILENDGGTGTAVSHFERKFFVYETMASGGIYGRRLSQFSLALLEGSGWYVADYDYAEPFFYGQGQGCDFINSQCSNTISLFDEFCIGRSKGCAPQGRSGGRCAGDFKTNGCRFVDPEPDYDCENPDAIDNSRFPDLEVYGREQNSKCFEGNLNTRISSDGATSFCFKFNCVGTGSDTQVEVQLGSNKLVCTQKGPRSVDGYYGTIECPDPLTFCNTVGKPYCPRNCMGRGDCVNNQCKCYAGFTGIDCGLYV
jgi:leishmanolysin